MLQLCIDGCIEVIDLKGLKESLNRFEAEAFGENLYKAVESRIESVKHGDLERWTDALSSLPNISPSSIELNTPTLTIGDPSDLNESEAKCLHNSLTALMPWRKGPLQFFDTKIDTEWRSDWKWKRLESHIGALKNRKVLDVGCGNGYHCWRMKAAGAKLVLGVDPSLLFACQFAVVQQYAKEPDIHLLPIGMEHLPTKSDWFDTVFSMGVLYHRRSPIDYIRELFAQLRPGGELVLETLVIDGDENQVLVPSGRYARMRNVWFIPSSQALALWVQRCGFENIRIVDECITSTDEQRQTRWMRYESLAESLDPENPNLTVEGLPSPKRAVLIATRK